MDMITESPSTEQQILTENGFYWRERDGIKVLVSRALEDAGFANGFSTRLGGISPFPAGSLNLAGFDEDAAENIYENRRRFLQVFEGDYKLTTAWQVHGDDIKTVRFTEDVSETDAKFDGLISRLQGVLIGVKTADCVPVLIGDPKTRAFAAVHAGWRGTVQSIVAKALRKMKMEYGTDPAGVICAIGPAATCKNYEIGQDVIDTFYDKLGNIGHIFTPTREGHALIDLHLANREQLTGAGVPDENIYTAPFCTMDRSDLFFSYRLEKKRYGKTGRLLSVIGLK
jgi:YfiH family protein